MNEPHSTDVIQAKQRADANINSFFRAEITRSLGANAKAFIAGGFIDYMGDNFTAPERAFIQNISESFERVALGFAYFTLLPAPLRPEAALRLCDKQLRTGWQRTGISIEANQTVAQHHKTCVILADILFPGDGQVAKHIALHDSGKSVIGDFTPFDAIARGDKARIEALGVRLATHTAADQGDKTAIAIRDATAIYDGNDPRFADLRKKMKDCDLLEMALEMAWLMTSQPKTIQAPLIEKFQEFWNYIEPQLSSPQAKRFYATMAKHRYGTNSKFMEIYKAAEEASFESTRPQEKAGTRPHPVQKL